MRMSIMLKLREGGGHCLTLSTWLVWYLITAVVDTYTTSVCSTDPASSIPCSRSLCLLPDKSPSSHGGCPKASSYIGIALSINNEATKYFYTTTAYVFFTFDTTDRIIPNYPNHP